LPMRIQIFVMGKTEPIGEVVTPPGEVRFAHDRGAISGSATLKICDLLAHHYGSFGEPFGMICDGEILNNCHIVNRRGSDADFIYDTRPRDDGPATLIPV